MIETNVNSISPIIISIPHSGRIYNKNFLKNILLSKKELQYSEDNYVDKILNKVLNNNVSYVKANFPRSYIDVNRSPLEVDPLMISSDIPMFEEKHYSKVKNGIGLIHRISYYGNNIYGNLLSRKEVINRIIQNYFPYHNALKLIIKYTKQKHKNILILDFHSMPSKSLDNNVDIVIGNNFNLSSDKVLSSKIVNYFNNYNYSLNINNPFSGGFITQFYGKPMHGVHVMQIEVNRALYMDEDTLEIKKNKLYALSKNLNSIYKNLLGDINSYNNY